MCGRQNRGVHVGGGPLTSRAPAVMSRFTRPPHAVHTLRTQLRFDAACPPGPGSQAPLELGAGRQLDLPPSPPEASDEMCAHARGFSPGLSGILALRRAGIKFIDLIVDVLH